MRIAIFGTGGAGGYFGAQLALAGEDVVFIARGEHLQAIREHGLRIETPTGELVVHAEATDDPATVGAVDVVIVGVKAWQVSDAAFAMRPMIAPQTFVVPLQNGVEAPTQLAWALGEEHVLGGTCGTISRLVGPGRILSVGQTNFIKFGELNNRPSERTQRLLAAFERAGVNAEVPADIEAAMWEKFIFVVPYGGVGSVTRATAGVIRSLPETRSMIESAIKEMLAVAHKREIPLTGMIVDKTMALLDALDESATTSLQRDITAGKPSELESWNGSVVRMARDARVYTPLHEFIYHSLLPSELIARGKLNERLRYKR